MTITRREALGILGASAAAGVVAGSLGEVLTAQTPPRAVFPKGAIIRTLLKDLPPDALAGPCLFHEHLSMRYPIGVKEHFTDDLAMLFHGTYTTPFYRRVRDALHHEVRAGVADDLRWAALAHDEPGHRSAEPLVAGR